MENKIKVVILCAAGMSSSLIVRSIKDNAAGRGLDIDVSCYPSLSYKELDYNCIDLVLLAPQVRGQMSDIKKYVEPYNIPVEQIGMREYGLIKGKDILEQMLQILNKK